MNQKELLELIKNGENSKVEFKDDRLKPNDLAREMISFANSQGGIILIGVDDKGNLIGNKMEDIEEWVMNICRNNCYPALNPIFEKVVFDGLTVAVVTILRQEGLVYRSSDGHYYLRVGSTVRDATPQELARLFQSASMFHYDTAPVYKTSLEDIDQDRLNYYFSQILQIKTKTESVENLLRNIKVMVEFEGKLYLTIAGVLVFCKYPERFLTQAGIIAIKFSGKEMDYNTMDKKEITGSLVNQFNQNGEVVSFGIIEQAIKFVQENTPVTSKMDGARRIDTPQYPFEAIREGIVNSLIHRDYTISGAKIRLFIFSDRIEIHSPGKLPNTVTIESMKRSSHYTRNPELYKLVAQYGYAENIGLGIPQKIIQKMIEHNGKEPKLEESGENFIITLFG